MAVEVEAQHESPDPYKELPRRVIVYRCARLLALLGLAASLPAFADDFIFFGDFDPPANDTCETATPLTLGSQLQGTTHGATANYDSGLETCAGFAQPGQDVVYSISMVAGTSYSVYLAPQGSFDPSVSLLGPGTPSTVCNVTPVHCVAGSDNGFNGDPESLQFTASTTGKYYIVVDSYASGETSSGNFSIVVTSQ